jgi:hypothetical protein
MRSIIALIVVLALSVAADAQLGSSDSSPAGGSESLGNQLLDDLTPSAPRTPAAPGRNTQSNSAKEDKSRHAVPRFDDLGEDIGQGSGPLSLVRVRQGMQRAESLLGQQSASRSPVALNQAASVQKQVVDQLDQLIAELSKQCQSGRCPPGDQPPSPSPSQQSQAKPGNSQSAAAAGQTAARDSSASLNNAGEKPVDQGDIEELAKQLWGHLPQRAREQMLQSFSGEFLPKYEREIEEYYRRLSEERQSEPARQ